MTNNEPKTVTASKIELQLFNNPADRFNEDAIRTGLVFTLSPFVGRIKIFLDGKDVLHNRPSNKTLFPFRYISWLADNFKEYLSKGLDEHNSESWRRQHFLQYSLGDFSPDLFFYRSRNELIVEDEFDNQRYSLNPQNFGFRIYEVTCDATDLLRKNPQLRNHDLVRDLEEKNKQNLHLLSSI
jgi:hypothetical protein